MGVILPSGWSGHNYLFARVLADVYNRMIQVGVCFYAAIIKEILEINDVITKEPGQDCEC